MSAGTNSHSLIVGLQRRRQLLLDYLLTSRVKSSLLMGQKEEGCFGHVLEAKFSGGAMVTLVAVVGLAEKRGLRVRL